MNDFVFKTLLELSEKSEETTIRIVVKIMFYFNCIIISIWTADNLGFRIETTVLSYDSALKLFSELKIIVPVFVFVFVTFSASLATRVISTIIGQIIRLIAYYRFFEKKKMIIYLLENKVLNKELNKGEEYDGFVSKLAHSEKIIKENFHFAEYYASLLVTFIFIYSEIVPNRFPELYFAWISIGLWALGLILVTLFAFVIFVKSKIEEANKLVRLADVQNTNLQTTNNIVQAPAGRGA